MNFDFLTDINIAIDKQYYEKLREKINNILYYLKKSIESLDDVDSILLRTYNVDDSLPSNVSVKNLREDLKNRVSYLSNTILPFVNSKINN